MIWDGITMLDVVNDPAHPYTNTALTVTSTVVTSTVEFYFRDDAGDLRFDDASLMANPVPEPSTWALMGISVSAIAAGAWWARRRLLQNGQQLLGVNDEGVLVS